jgi:hypothetical protein
VVVVIVVGDCSALPEHLGPFPRPECYSVLVIFLVFWFGLGFLGPGKIIFRAAAADGLATAVLLGLVASGVTPLAGFSLV